MAAQTSMVTFHHSLTTGLSLDAVLPKQGKYWVILPTGVEFDKATKIWTIHPNLLTPEQLSERKIVISIDYQIPGQRPHPFILDFSQILRRNSVS